jgi:CDP-glucose 4,6-dehydratase
MEAVGLTREVRPADPAGVRGRSVLVTGGHGLIGGWLTHALLSEGATVTVIDRDPRPDSLLAAMGLEDRVNIVHGDIAADAAVARALAEYEVEVVFHLAAQALVQPANAAPLDTFESNVRGTWLLLEACRSAGTGRVIVASSDKAYGASAQLPYREDHALVPAHPYEVSKAAADMIARSYWHTWRLPVAVTRLANVYGGGDPNRSRLIPEAVTAALAGRAPVVRSDGSPERDFLYAEDAAAAYLAIAGALHRGTGCGEAFNAGTGRPHRVGDVVEEICRLAGTGVTPEIRGSGNPPGEIDRQWVDAGKLRALTGWEPTVELEEGLSRTLDWHRTHALA